MRLKGGGREQRVFLLLGGEGSVRKLTLISFILLLFPLLLQRCLFCGLDFWNQQPICLESHRLNLLRLLLLRGGQRACRLSLSCLLALPRVSTLLPEPRVGVLSIFASHSFALGPRWRACWLLSHLRDSVLCCIVPYVAVYCPLILSGNRRFHICSCRSVAPYQFFCFSNLDKLLYVHVCCTLEGWVLMWQ